MNENENENRNGVGVGVGGEKKSSGRLARWNSSASLGGGRKLVREEKGRDGIGRLDA